MFHAGFADISDCDFNYSLAIITVSLPPSKGHARHVLRAGNTTEAHKQAWIVVWIKQLAENRNTTLLRFITHSKIKAAVTLFRAMRAERTLGTKHTTKPSELEDEKGSDLILTPGTGGSQAYLRNSVSLASSQTTSLTGAIAHAVSIPVCGSFLASTPHTSTPPWLFANPPRALLQIRGMSASLAFPDLKSSHSVSHCLPG